MPADESPNRCVQESKVRCTTLDTELPWRDRRVSMILLDVEGHELSALEGAAAIIRRWRPVLALERKLSTIMQEAHDASSPLFDTLSSGARRPIFDACELNYQVSHGPYHLLDLAARRLAPPSRSLKMSHRCVWLDRCAVDDCPRNPARRATGHAMGCTSTPPHRTPRWDRAQR